MKQIERIDAVNRILKIKTAERVTTLDELNTVPQAAEADDELNWATTLIQTEFKWHYNTVTNGELTSDNDGILTLPDNLGFIDIHSTTAAIQVAHLRPVAGKIYDIYNHTFNIGVAKTVRYSGRLVWEFEDLPVQFQMLAVAHARKEVAGSGAHLNAQRFQIEEVRYNQALSAAMKFDDTLSGGRVREPNSQWRRQPPRNNGFV